MAEMAVLPIVTGTEQPILHKKTVPVKKVTKDLLKLLKDMEATCAKAEGAGIAAPRCRR